MLSPYEQSSLGNVAIAAASMVSMAHTNSLNAVAEANARRKRSSQACLICRKKKIKCDGIKPVCGYCADSGFECRYAAPKRRGPPRKMPVLDLPLDCSSLVKDPHAPPSSGLSAQLPAHFEAHKSINKVAYLVELDDLGGVQVLRTVSSTHGIHGLQDACPESFYHYAFVVNPPVNSVFAPCSPSALAHVDQDHLPPLQIQHLLFNYYFEAIRPLVPVVGREQLEFYMDPKQGTRYDFEKHAFLALAATWYWRSGRPRPPHLDTPAVYSHRARMHLGRIVSMPPALSRVSALVALAFAELGDTRGISWTIGGMAIRMAQDIGIHVDMRGRAATAFFSPAQIQRAETTWWCCYVLDRELSLTHGRPVCIRDDDCAVLPMRPNSSDPQLADYAWQVALAHIQGKIAGAVNGFRTCMPAAIAEIANELDSWRNALPWHLKIHGSQNAKDCSSFAFDLHARYWHAALSLHRPQIAGLEMTGGILDPRAPEICINAARGLLHTFIMCRQADMLKMLSCLAVNALQVLIGSMCRILSLSRSKIGHVLGHLGAPLWADALECFAEAVYFEREVSEMWPGDCSTLELHTNILKQLQRGVHPPLEWRSGMTASPQKSASNSSCDQPRWYESPQIKCEYYSPCWSNDGTELKTPCIYATPPSDPKSSPSLVRARNSANYNPSHSQ